MKSFGVRDEQHKTKEEAQAQRDTERQTDQRGTARAVLLRCPFYLR
jgi:hypothetical protein